MRKLSHKKVGRAAPLRKIPSAAAGFLFLASASAARCPSVGTHTTHTVEMRSKRKEKGGESRLRSLRVEEEEEPNKEEGGGGISLHMHYEGGVESIDQGMGAFSIIHTYIQLSLAPERRESTCCCCAAGVESLRKLLNPYTHACCEKRVAAASSILSPRGPNDLGIRNWFFSGLVWWPRARR